MPGIWKPLTTQPNFKTSTMMLLTDGRVMVQEEAAKHWHALTPDSNGSYLNGQWSTLADMSFWRRYYSSGILKDGRVFLCGGEQSGDTGDSNKGEIYDPVTDSWSPISTPPWPTVGDAATCVLPDGKVMIGSISSGACLIYDPSTDSWATTGAQPGNTNEESWVLLPDNTILTVQCFPPYGGQKYLISSGVWQDEGTPPVTLVDPVMAEIGPAMFMYNGKAIFFGAMNSSGHAKTALYTHPTSPSGVGTWAAGPDIPNVNGQTVVCNDCPAALMPNGKVLFCSAPFVYNQWGSPITFFEYDPVANTITPAPTPPNNGAQLFWSRMLLLPSGEVLFSPSANNVQVYVPDGGPLDAWRPTITGVTTMGATGTITGTQLNGLSQACMYGDDCYPCTNYPLVQLTNVSSGTVQYCRTFNFSTMGIATGTTAQSCQFDLAGVAAGQYELRVIANGISSLIHNFQVGRIKPQAVDVVLKQEFEWFGKLVAEGDPFDWLQQIIDPEIIAMQSELRSLANGVSRLNSLIQTLELPQVGSQVAKEAKGQDRADNVEGQS
jgi:hypothetical protein